MEGIHAGLELHFLIINFCFTVITASFYHDNKLTNILGGPSSVANSSTNNTNP